MMQGAQFDSEQLVVVQLVRLKVEDSSRSTSRPSYRSCCMCKPCAIIFISLLSVWLPIWRHTIKFLACITCMVGLIIVITQLYGSQFLIMSILHSQGRSLWSSIHYRVDQHNLFVTFFSADFNKGITGEMERFSFKNMSPNLIQIRV